MKKVLMIAYRFPPMISGGVFRTVKFEKNLSSFGIVLRQFKNSLTDEFKVLSQVDCG